MMATMIAIRTDGNADGEPPTKPVAMRSVRPKPSWATTSSPRARAVPHARTPATTRSRARRSRPATSCRHDDEAERPQGAEAVQGAEERCQPVRQGVEEVEDRALAAGDVAVVERAHDQDRDPEEQAEPVARAPPQRALGRGAEHADPPRARRLHLGRLARGHHGYMVPTRGLGVA